MNFRKQAEKLEKFLDQELRSKSPILVLPDRSLIYKRFKIKQNNLGLWDLRFINGDIINCFNLKATAVLAAKFYHYDRFDTYNKIKNLDTEYWTSSTDSLTFKQRYESAKDHEKRDIYLARWELTYARSKHYQQEIERMFTHAF